ncbi:alkaline phosphatase family protein [Streptomyces sp. NPDC047022]|uniref:phospholipase C n=1 Tax=Streptomyces sp. NPDC047022 TaxID=3155737 RepID=UPI0033F2DFF7
MKRRNPGARTRRGLLAALAAVTVLGSAVPAAATGRDGRHGPERTETPVKHLVVIFDENVSFDHYFGTYPVAANTDGTPFHASPRTPKSIDTLSRAGLLTNNPNQYAPRRLSSSQAVTCDQRHNYSREQLAANGGKMDQFVQYTDSGKCSGGLYYEPGLVMDYYDGNTVTALWNYAQHYTLNDRSFSSTYGPSTPGALNLIAGQTHGVISMDPASGTQDPKQTSVPDAKAVASPDATGVGTVINDPDPAFDDCSGNDHSSTDALAAMQGRNIGDLLNAKDVTWGWFQGGFRPSTAWDGQQGHYAKCGGTTHANVAGNSSVDYSPHHEPFQYYRSTANPHHLPPASVAEIGHDGRANHNYDLTDFDAALTDGNLPAVSFLKAPEYQDGHGAYSDPIDEQHFLVSEINKIQQSPEWRDTAVVVAYDDSDGWYNHVYAPLQNGSTDNTPASGKPTDASACQAASPALGGHQDRCGPGPRQPLLVISPFAKVNHIDHTPTEQASITAFIEDNWHTGRIGDASFDQRAGSLADAFDFCHPNGRQLLLNQDGSVKSLTRIPAHPVRPRAVDLVNAAPVADTAAAPSPLRPAALAGAVVAAGGAGWLLSRRRRRGRTTA